MNIISRELIAEINELYTLVDAGNTTAMLKLAKVCRQGIPGDECIADTLLEMHNHKTRHLYEEYAQQEYYTGFCKERGLQEDSEEAEEAFQEWVAEQNEDYENYCERLVDRGL